MSEVIAFITDTHDRLDLLQQQLAGCREVGVETVVHLGDVIAAETLEPLLDFDLHMVSGNGDDEGQHRKMVEAAGGTHHGEEATLEFGEKTFFLHHGVDHGKSYGLAKGETGVDYVFHGHWHNFEHNTYDHGAVVNPGSEGMTFYFTESDILAHFEYEAETP